MIERVLAFSVRQRWLVLLAALAAVISGAWSLTRLPIDAVPDVTNVQVQINAIAPAFTPIEIEKQVTVPIETALAGTPGLESNRSFSRNGFAQITAVFADRTDIYFARQQVAERLTDEFQRTVYLRTVQDWIIRPQMKTVPGVAGADAIGGYVKQYHVQPDPARLIAYGLSFSQIVSAIEANNVSRGANYIERNGEGYVVRASGRVESLAEIEDIVVATRGAVPVRVKDVAEVALGRELRTGSASVNGREVVLGTALMLIGGNSRTVAAAADAKIKDINRTLPPSIRARTVLNRTQLVDATIHTVATNLAEGALLVVLVLFLLLGNFRAALVTAVVIPVTMLMTSTGMLQGRLSANLMSLGALDFGLIVDGAVIIALASAFVLSLTFVPAMIAIVVTGRVREKENLLVRCLRALYRPALVGAIRAPWLVIAGALVLFTAAALLFASLGQEFTPTLDEKNIVMEVKRIPSTSLSQSQMMQFDNERMLSRFPQVAFVFSRTGTPDLAADPMPPSASDTYIILRPRDQWPDSELSKEDLIRQFDAEASKLPGNKFGFSQPIQMRFNELIAGVREDLAVKVFGDEFGPMLRAANQIAAVLRGVDGAANVKVEQVTGLPFLEIKIDKGEIARRGLSLSEVQDVIGVAIGGRAAGIVFEHDRRFQIIVRLQDALRGDIEALQNLPVALPRASSGVGAATVPLRQLANFNFAEGPNQVSRENGKRLVVVTADVRGRDIGSLVDEAQAQIGQHVTLPPGYWLGWGGQFENFVAARQRLTIVVPLCFALIFLLLWSALSSARDALLVLSAVPLALTGGVASLWLRDMTFSSTAAVGLIAVSDVAVLNGLVMLSFIKQLIEQGATKHDAIVRGALTRLRPVVMTALVASLGFVPMAIATGTGAEVQKPLATVVIGGLISATLLTLFVLPALYARFSGEKMPLGEANKRGLPEPDFGRVKQAAE